MPQIEDGDRSYYLAFRSLNKSRLRTEAGPQAVQISELLAYCQLLGIDGAEDRSKFLYMIQELDAEYLDISSERQKQEISRLKSKRPG